MISFMLMRREELRTGRDRYGCSAAPAATALVTNGVGSRGNVAHLILTPPVSPQSQKMAAYRDRIAALKADRIAKAAKNAKAKTMQEISLQRMRRAMIVRELALMGFPQYRVAAFCRTSPARVLQMGRDFNIVFAKRPRLDSALCRAVRRGYEDGKSCAQIATETGSTEGTVKGLASKMKITQPDPFATIRGFHVPEDRRKEYRELIRLGCTPTEAGMCMLLLARPEVGK